MKKPRINPEGHELLRQVMEQYQPKTINDIREMLKDLFADTIEDMLKAELDTELGYFARSMLSKSGLCLIQTGVLSAVNSICSGAQDGIY